jgi:hypothetical protein
MRAALVTAALIVMTILPANTNAEGSYNTAGDFIEEYGNGENILPRLYIRGIGDGIGIYNVLLQSRGVAQAYRPPQKVGLVDAQYVAIMKSFVAKFPKTKASPVAAVLLYALQDAFPCHGQ